MHQSFPVVADSFDSTHPGNQSLGNNTIPETATLCNTVRKWNLRFDGRRDTDAISFLERLHEFMESYEILPDRILKALPELLKDSALLWYRNNRNAWMNFSDFLRDFQFQYFPQGYLLNLEDEIRRRTQGDGELFKHYAIALCTLIRRRGGLTVNDKLERLYSNMHPNYKMYVRRRDFVNLPGLMKVAEEYETCLKEKSNFRPPPSPAQALVAETAYQGKNKYQSRSNFQTLMINESRAPSNLNAQHQRYKLEGERKNTVVDDRQVRYNYHSLNKADDFGSSQGQSSKMGQQRNENPPKNMICWNCDKTGHLYRDCRKPKHLKCFYCKRPGVKTDSCDCPRTGNGQRTTEPGGRRSPRTN